MKEPVLTTRLTEKLTVDSRNVRELIEAGKFEYVRDVITSKYFRDREGCYNYGAKKISVKVVDFDRDIPFYEILRILNKARLRPATLKELLALYNNLQDRLIKFFPLVCLGSTWEDSKGDELCVRMDDSYNRVHGKFISISTVYFQSVFYTQNSFAAVVKG